MPGVPLLIGVIEEDLKGLFVGLSLRIKDANAFLVRHAPSLYCVTVGRKGPDGAVHICFGRLSGERDRGINDGHCRWYNHRGQVMLAFLWPEDGIECRHLDHFTCRDGMHGLNVTLVGTKKRKTIRRKQIGRASCRERVCYPV